VSDLGISASSISIPPLAPTSASDDPKPDEATDPNLQHNESSGSIGTARTGTSVGGAILSGMGDAYGLYKQHKGVPAPPAFNQIYTPLRALAKGADLPLRILVYAPSLSKSDGVIWDKAALSAKIAASAGDLATEIGLALVTPFNKNYMQLEHVLVVPRRPSPAAPSHGGDIPMRILSRPETIIQFSRPTPGRNPTQLVITGRNQPPASRTLPTQDQSFVRHGIDRMPFTRHAVTATPSSDTLPLIPSDTLPMKAVKGLNYGSNGFGFLSSLVDIYFGAKAIATEKEPLAKTQGALYIASGASGVGATTLATASLADIAGPAAVTTAMGLGVAASLTGGAALGMTLVPLTLGRDNHHRAYKFYNDLAYDTKQLELADKQLTQRTGPSIRDRLLRLNQHYGVEPKTVWLNNNGADLMNEINSPNNTGSGQWKPDAEGDVWSDFQGKYIKIDGIPHQQMSHLDLASEHDGSNSVPAPRTTVRIEGDDAPDKTPQQMQTLGGEPSHYTELGWRRSTQQPWLYKDYGYQTSSWGHYWETSIPASVSAGPLYVAHDAQPHGKDRVVLIEDTRLAPTTPLPNDHYVEDRQFQFNGNDSQMLTARQMGDLLHDKKKILVPAQPGDKVQAEGMKFNVAESEDKKLEDAYREAVYPMSDLPHVRSPDAFERTIATDASARTVVSMPYVRNPVTIIARNPNDVIDLPSMPEADIRITLPPVDPAIDKRQLGLSSGISLRRQTTAGLSTQVYAFPNGKALTVVATDAASAARFARTFA
jgi:hypothetical protein